MKAKSPVRRSVLAEPEVLKTIGAESRRNGTDRLTQHQIEQIIKTARHLQRRPRVNRRCIARV
jgi:hypothetical protein